MLPTLARTSAIFRNFHPLKWDFVVRIKWTKMELYKLINFSMWFIVVYSFWASFFHCLCTAVKTFNIWTLCASCKILNNTPRKFPFNIFNCWWLFLRKSILSDKQIKKHRIISSKKYNFSLYLLNLYRWFYVISSLLIKQNGLKKHSYHNHSLNQLIERTLV